LQSPERLTDPYDVPYSIEKKNDFKMLIVEVRSQMNITIDFMLQLPAEHKSLFENYDLTFYEDLSASMSKIRIVR
jgi:hypothetical protein